MASKIKKITVSNLKAVSALTADFNGCTAIITGRNNSGKSSFLKSLTDRIRGLKPDTVLKHEEKEGSAELELTTGERFIWTFNTKGEKLLFITEKNIKSSVTKDIASYYFPGVFDVDKFLQQTPKEQNKTLQKLTGIDFTELDKIYQDAFEQRAFFNKQLKIEQAKAEIVDDSLPLEETVLDELIQEIAGIEAHNLRIQNVKDGIAQRNQKNNEIDTEILALEEKIKDLKFKKNGIVKEINDGEAWLQEPQNQLKENKEELEAQLLTARKKNIEIFDNNKARQQQVTIEKATKDAADWDKEVKRLEAEKIDVIKNASMPEGFGFSADGITYNGFEFSRQQLSSSALAIAALKLGLITLGEVKTLYFDASLLDRESLTEIGKWADSVGCQLLIELVDRDGNEKITYELVSEIK